MGLRAVQRDVLQHFGRTVDYEAVKRALRTARDGTSTGDILRYLRRRGLVAQPCRMTMRELTRALTQGCVVLAYVDGDHVAVVYGVDKEHVYVADPSLWRSLGRRVTRRAFLRRFDREGVLVRPGALAAPRPAHRR